MGDRTACEAKHRKIVAKKEKARTHR